MAITVTHKFVSAIPDGDDASVVRPSNWNDTHELTGLGTMAEQNANAVAITGGTITGTSIPATDVTGLGTMSTQNANNVAITGGSISGATVSGYIPSSEKAQPLGVATLDAGGKVPTSQIPLQGDLNYQGTWNATTNSPTLTSSVGTKGYYYVVDVAGTTNLNGITDWQIGDWAIFNGSVWQKVDNTDAVTSVNGFTGTVVLTTTNVAEGTNQYYTDARARAAISAGTGLSYNSTSGAMNFSTPAVATWAETPSSANLAAAMTDETGTGSIVFANSPTLSSPLIDNSNPYISFGDGTAVTVAAGRQWYNATTGSWNLGMGGGNITQQIGEELFVYGKASATITDSPLKIVYQTGQVGASGVVTFAPTVSGITDGNRIIGVATENITSGNFGRITSYGVIRGITADGSAYGETWADGDEIWYNPVTGNPTKVKPSAPNLKVSVGTIINAGSSGSGSIQVEINHGSVLGGTDSNVQLTTPSAAQILTYDVTDAYWKNTSLASGTGISVGTASNGVLTVTNSLPDQTVALANGTGISVTGTYPNFTITNTAPSSGGTVTSVTATAPVASTGGTTPVISMPAATTSVSGYLTSTDWNTFNNKGNGTVTSVTATSPVTSTGGTTPVIAMPAATGSVNGYLTSTDWTTFNGKANSFTYTTSYIPYGQGTTTPNQASNFTFDGTTQTAPVQRASNGIVVNSNTVSASYTIASGDSAMSAGPITVASGQAVTISSGSRWVVL